MITQATRVMNRSTSRLSSAGDRDSAASAGTGRQDGDHDRRSGQRLSQARPVRRGQDREHEQPEKRAVRARRDEHEHRRPSEVERVHRPRGGSRPRRAHRDPRARLYTDRRRSTARSGVRVPLGIAAKTAMSEQSATPPRAVARTRSTWRGSAQSPARAGTVDFNARNCLRRLSVATVASTRAEMPEYSLIPRQ